MKKEVEILYTNWKGETRIRHIVPLRMEYEKTDWHPEFQWILVAFDVEKQAERNFAMADIQSWRGVE